MPVEKHVYEEGTQVFIGEPADYPYALVDDIRSLLKTMPDAKKAWLLLIMNVRTSEQNLLLVVDTHGDIQKTFEAIWQTASAHLERDKFIDMLPFSDSFGRKAVRSIKPFYKKGIFSK
jgi:hypothetical protein